MPNRLLSRYFQGRGVFGDLDFAALKEAQPDALFDAWQELPDGQRNGMDAEFREIFAMSCEKGFRAVLDEAAWHLEAKPQTYAELVEKLAALDNHYERAMVTFLAPAAYSKGAALFSQADTLPSWRKRKTLPHQPAAVHEDSRRELADLIRSHFHQTEGRGKNCVVEACRRGELEIGR